MLRSDTTDAALFIELRAQLGHKHIACVHGVATDRALSLSVTATKSIMLALPIAGQCRAYASLHALCMHRSIVDQDFDLLDSGPLVVRRRDRKRHLGFDVLTIRKSCHFQTGPSTVTSPSTAHMVSVFPPHPARCDTFARRRSGPGC